MRLPPLIAAVSSIGVGTIVLLASPGPAQTLDAEIRTEVRRYVAAINAGNPDALARLYLDHAETSSLGDGRIQRGWPGVAALFREVYRQLGAVAMTVDSVSVLRLGPDAAVAVMRYRWTLGRTDPVTETGAMTLVYVRTPEGWRVAHDHTSTLAPVVATEPPAPPVSDSGPPRPTRETQDCRVTRIIDGDTIECRPGGRVRLIGLDTPERDQAPFGRQATRALEALIPEGSTVQLERDVEAHDRYGRALAYVWHDGVLVNWALVRDGWAVLSTFPPNVQYVDWLREAQRRAREESRGLWATEAFDCTPAEHRRGRCE